MTATHTQSVAKEARTRQVDLSDLVREYADELPKTGWLTRLNLVRPRENQQCLPNVTRITKRVVDVIVASLLLVLMSPCCWCVSCLSNSLLQDRLFTHKLELG